MPPFIILQDDLNSSYTVWMHVFRPLALIKTLFASGYLIVNKSILISGLKILRAHRISIKQCVRKEINYCHTET